LTLKDRGNVFQYLRWQALIMNQYLGKKNKMDGGLLKLNNQSNALHRERGGLELNNEGAKINKYKMGLWN